MCMCVSQLGKPSTVQSPKTATPQGTPCSSPASAASPSSSFGNLRGPSDFPLSLHARLTTCDLSTRPWIFFHGSKVAGFKDNKTGDSSPHLGPEHLSKHFTSFMSLDPSESFVSWAGLAIPMSGRGNRLRERRVSSKVAHSRASG